MNKQQLLIEIGEYKQQLKQLQKQYPDMLVNLITIDKLREMSKDELTNYLDSLKYVLYHHT